MSEIHHLPLTAILPHALPRDRSQIEPEALAELQLSIATSGLRQPIEVFELATPEPPFTHGLISGLRRLTAHQALAALRQNGDFTTIAAFLRQPRSIPHAIALMIEENEARADLSPWEKGRILVDCVSQGIFETLDQAVKSLHPNITRQKRTRLRACATVVEDLEGRLTDPEHMVERQLLRLSAALRGGFSDLIAQILTETAGQSLQSQWSALLPTLTEAEKGEEETPATANSPARPRRMLHLKQGLTIRREETPATANSPARPRRMLHLKQGLTIRREETPGGYALRFSGDHARRGGLMDDVMDLVEREFQPGFGK